MVYRSTEHNKHRLIKNIVFYVYTLMFEISIIHSYTRTVDEPSILILIYRFNQKKVISKWKGRATILPFSQNIINMHHVHVGFFSIRKYPSFTVYCDNTCNYTDANVTPFKMFG